MSIQLFLLKSGEYIIADGKELISNQKPVGYLLDNPEKVTFNSSVFFSEEEESEVKISLSPWIILTTDTKITIPFDWVVTVVEPIESIKKIYNNGKDN